MMGWLSPKCPSCGGVIEKTGYSFPYPNWRCPFCIAASKRKSEIDDLRERIEKLEKKP